MIGDDELFLAMSEDELEDSLFYAEEDLLCSLGHASVVLGRDATCSIITRWLFKKHEKPS